MRTGLVTSRVVGRNANGATEISFASDAVRRRQRITDWSDKEYSQGVLIKKVWNIPSREAKLSAVREKKGRKKPVAKIYG